MTFETALRLFFSILPAQIPVIAVGAIGLYFAVSRREVAPHAYKSAAWGFLLLILQPLAPALQLVVLRLGTNTPPQGATPVLFWSWSLSIAAQLLFVAALVLLARAVFLDRKPGQVSNSD
jgi:hypothetical protein